jgi:hypothetical protein
MCRRKEGRMRRSNRWWGGKEKRWRWGLMV